MAFSWHLFLFSLLAPPAICIWLLLIGLVLLAWRRAVAGWTLSLLGLGSLYLLSTGLCAGWLAAGLERDPAIPPAELAARLKGCQAIVVLGAGRDRAAAEFGGADMPSSYGTARLRYGAYVYRQTGLPVLLSGGSVEGEAEPESALMATSMARDFVVNVRWQESTSRTTWENAQNSAVLLKREGIDHIALVTSAAHMWRAKRAFEYADFTVTPAPTDFSPFGSGSLALALIPSAQALEYSRQALHEYVGLAWYRVKALVE